MLLVALYVSLSKPHHTPSFLFRFTTVALRRTFAILLELCYEVQSVARSDGLDHVLFLCFQGENEIWRETQGFWGFD